MSKKIFVLILAPFFVVALFFASFKVGLKYMKEKHSYFYRTHLYVYDYIFKDTNVVSNIRTLQAIQKADDDRKQKININYNKTLKRNADKALIIPTADESGQAMHPDIIYDSNGIEGHKYWLACTPYPLSDEKFENPHILVSDDGNEFYVPSGLTNPVAGPPSDVNEGGHLSDTDLMRINGKFVLHYVYNKKGIKGPSKFYRLESKDGVHWSKPELAFQCDKTIEGYSPAFIYENGITKMWYYAGEDNLVYFESKDNEKTWSQVEKSNLKIPGWKPWHIDIIKTDMGYEGLLCARSLEMQNRALFYIKSSNGKDWTCSKEPIIFPSPSGWDNKEIYRSTLLKVDGKYRIWYSARNDENIWGTGYTEFTQQEINDLE